MRTILTSSLSYYGKDENGRRIPGPFYWYNGFLDLLRKTWKKDAKVLIMASSPEDYEKNDDVLECLKASFEVSGLSVSSAEICDARDPRLAEQIAGTDVVLLSGGHVPTQNRFFRQIGLKEKLTGFNGTVIAYSAGSMNCAETVYAAPELDGEALDPDYERWIPGLGLTDINIYPHYQWLKNDVLDGMCVMEDITYPDSKVHEIIAMNDGTYIVIENGKSTLYGEAYRIKDGILSQICQNGMSVELA